MQNLLLPVEKSLRKVPFEVENAAMVARGPYHRLKVHGMKRKNPLRLENQSATTASVLDTTRVIVLCVEVDQKHLEEATPLTGMVTTLSRIKQIVLVGVTRVLNPVYPVTHHWRPSRMKQHI